MEIKISRELVFALKSLQGKITVENFAEPCSYMDSRGINRYIPGPKTFYAHISLDVCNFSDMAECEKWMNINSKSFNIYYLNIGPFKKLYPIEIDFSINVISFSADNFDYKPSWKDWFIVEGETDAPFVSLKLLSNVCDP